MKASTLLKLRLISRWLRKEAVSIKNDFSLITHEEVDRFLLRASIVFLTLVGFASCGMAYSLAKSYGWLN